MKTEIKIYSIDGKVLCELDKECNSIIETLNDTIIKNIDLSGVNLCEASLIRANLSGANLCGANLCEASLIRANLSGANLCEANLRGASLREADLSGADLRGANLSGANLSGANLSGANLRGASLREANLSGANLCGANLCGANLCEANLRGANLRGANLCGANLCEANLRGANLRGIKINIFTTMLLSQCPMEGAFIGWKIANNKIIKLEICKDALRSSATTLKCRCSSAKVLEIQNLDGTKSDLMEISSNYDSNFIYKVGEIVKVENFDKNRFNECSAGIHFFISREMAVAY